MRLPRRTISKLPALFVASFACSGDGGGGGTTGPPDTGGSTVASVVIASATVALGGTVLRSATVKDANGNRIASPTVTWNSANPSIAAVAPTGLVTGAAVGTTSITASSGGKTGTAVITVVDLTFSSISAGAQHVCGLSGTSVYCWGDYSFGESGSLTDPESCSLATCSTTPRRGVSGPAFVRLSAGGNHTCGVTADDTAYCWGDNFLGQLGAAPSDTCTEGARVRSCSRSAIAVNAGGVRFNLIAAGGGHTCGLTPARTAYCWGFGDQGQLGQPAGESCNNFPCNRAPAIVSGGLTFSALSAGLNHSCGLDAAGTADCWGGNEFGQLGASGNGSTPMTVTGGIAYREMATGFAHTCAISNSGAAYCWGSNGSGQLGDGTTQNRAAPVLVTGGLVWISITAGVEHTCGIASSNLAYCWGNNSDGGLGSGTTSSSLSPVAVQRGLVFAQLSAGLGFTCGRTISGRVYCWGSNGFGQLGTGSPLTPGSTSPIGVAGFP